MLIGGWQKFSAIDYPGKASTIIFTQGCPFRCPFCHNPELVMPEKFTVPLVEEVFFDFLARRRDQLDAVVITGGEPTIQDDLANFMARIKEMGFLVKLDTNGANPDVLSEILRDKLVDYLAMDVKAPFDKYATVSVSRVAEEKIRQSIELVMGSGLSYEFRTTVVREQLLADDILAIGEMIAGAELYVLQKFLPYKTLSVDFKNMSSYTDDEFETMVQRLGQYVRRAVWR